LRGLLGLGGVTAAGVTLHDAEAARRGSSGPPTPGAEPTQAPQPTEPAPLPTEPAPLPTATTAPSCPGSQTPCGANCCCPAGNTKCGAECCADGQSTCCDNACCFGTCYGEELCCPHPQVFCAVSGQCCAVDETCQAEGCGPATCGGIGAVCVAGSDCCAPNVCSAGVCAAECPAGARDCDGVCYPGGCCSDSDCGGSCLVCGSDHVCHSCAESGQCLICDASSGACVVGCPPGLVCQGSQCVVDCPTGTSVCYITEPGFTPPHPSCCGGGARCDSCVLPGGDCECVPTEGGGPGITCPPPQYACCGTNSDGDNTCTCCASGQTCDSSGTAGVCNG
jgi:hypothetical protein